jgi:hypothetical protein
MLVVGRVLKAEAAYGIAELALTELSARVILIVVDDRVTPSEYLDRCQ